MLCAMIFLMLGPAGAVAAEEAADPAVLTLARIFTDEEFEEDEFGPARWLEDASGYTTLEDSEDRTEDEDAEDKDAKAKDIVRYDPETGRREIMVPSARLIPKGRSKPLKIDNYTWSDDGKKLLVFTNTKRVWRTNTRGDYYVLDLETWKLRKLGGEAEPSTLMFAKFSPDGRRVAYVRQKNIYVQDLKSFRVKRLTRDGGGNIINGTSDWVYEEEFRLRDGFRWSPDGKSIAYWQFDTEGVNFI
jgi:dipeptidyl-peptidase-4